MFFGVDLPNFAEYADVALLGELAHEAEDAGWDGFFLWDHIAMPWPMPMADPWIALTAVALRTARLRFGPLVTPLPRRRPAKVARETATLDQLSGGRLILGVGIGGGGPEEWANLGDPADLRTRGAMLDEGLQVLTGLWSGQPTTIEGPYYTVRNAQFLPAPVQQPRIPIWVAGYWPNHAPFRRAARWDGAFPFGRDLDPLSSLSPLDLAAIRAYIQAHRTDPAPFDLVHLGMTSGTDPAQDAALVAPYAESGVTWWLEALHGLRGPLELTRERIRNGPPRIA